MPVMYMPAVPYSPMMSLPYEKQQDVVGICNHIYVRGLVDGDKELAGDCWRSFMVVVD